MIAMDWSRGHINSQIKRVKRMFRWAVENELIPPAVHQGLCAVAGLKQGRSAARETDPVMPVPSEHVEAIQRFVSPQVWALVQLQLYSAARPGELLILRPQDIDTSGCVWTATPTDHKNAFRGKRRVIYLGPKCQGILRPFMLRAADTFLFSPREAEAARYANADTHRRPDQKSNPRKTDRLVGDRYTVHSYRRAVMRACVEAGIPAWAPHRLRHTAATQIRRDFGLEAAQVILGHASADVTEIYAEIDRARGIEIALKIG
jgi:integrase